MAIWTRNTTSWFRRNLVLPEVQRSEFRSFSPGQCQLPGHEAYPVDLLQGFQETVLRLGKTILGAGHPRSTHSRDIYATCNVTSRADSGEIPAAGRMAGDFPSEYSSVIVIPFSTEPM